MGAWIDWAVRGTSTARRRRRAALVLSLAACAHVASAAEPESHAHVPIKVDAELDWETLLATALAAHPRGPELSARAAEAAAWTARGRQWLAAAPAMYFSYLSDRPLSDVGQREYDVGVELPLWRGGQRSSVRALASSATAASAAASAALQLEAAGLLRGALWDIQAAANDVAAASDTVTVAEELLRAVERRNARGDLPLADVLLARAALLERRQAVVTAGARLVDAERAYYSLTGLDRRPATFAEERSAKSEIDATHPLVALADAEVARASSQAEVAGGDARGNIALTLGPHRQYDPFGTMATDSVTFAVRVPIGGGSHVDAARATAARLAASAAAERGALLRRLDLDFHEAEHGLEVVEESAALVAERRELAGQQVRMAQLAFTQGEIELRELLRIQEAEQLAAREVQRLAIERERTIAALNQAVGELP
jgi:cobalt-zinc-cadmium efflux system outer membrane protein